jgi:hypothetical protein
MPRCLHRGAPPPFYLIAGPSSLLDIGGARPPGLAALWMAAMRARCPAAPLAHWRGSTRGRGRGGLPGSCAIEKMAGDAVGMIRGP